MMQVPTTLQDVPVTLAVLSALTLYGAFVIGVVLYLVRVRDQVRTEARTEAELARKMAREGREDLAAFKLEVSRLYVSHEQLAPIREELRAGIGEIRGEFRAEIRDLRQAVLTAIAATAGQPRRRRDPEV